MKIVIWKDGTHLLVEGGITYEYENDKNWLTTISITEVKKAATALNENIHPLFKEILDAHCSPKAEFFLPAVSDGEEERDDYYRIDFINCDKEYNYTICRDWSEVMDYISLAESDIVRLESNIKISSVKLTEKEFDEFFKTIKP